MGRNSKIEWTTHTFNAWVGCSKVSEGCDHCYAEAMVKRAPHLVHDQQGVKHLPVWGNEAPRRMTSEGYWKNPLRWNKAAAAAGVRERVFVNSMSDTFDAWDGQVLNAGCLETLDEVRQHLWSLISECPALDFLLLTKRIENVARMVPVKWMQGQWPKNAWLGSTVENQARLEERIGKLAELPAPIRFLSYEPALSEIHLKIDLDATANRFGLATCPKCKGWGVSRLSAAPDVNGTEQETACGWCHGSGCAIDWIIIGGESGRGGAVRPFNPAWADWLLKQCKLAGIQAFVKQMGSNPTLRSGSGWGPILDSKGGVMEQWPAQLRVRQIPVAP